MPRLSRLVHGTLGLAVLLAGACSSAGVSPGPTDEPDDEPEDTADAAAPEEKRDGWAGLPDLAPSDAKVVSPPASVVVYAHSGSDLFRVEPETLTLSRVGPFVI